MIFPAVRFSSVCRFAGRAGLAAALGLALAPASAAPLDGLLTAHPEQFSKRGYVEVAYDAMNDTLDVFDIRDDDATLAGTNVGDYNGYHVRGGVSVTPALWLDGGLWRRKLDYRADQVSIDSWQIAGQYRLLERNGAVPALALRLSAWGNRSGELSKSTPTTFAGVTLDTVTVRDPEDRQFQLDLVGSWKPADAHELTLLASVGSSSVSVGEITATDTQGGCLYDIAFGPTAVTGTLAAPCNADVVVNSFSIPNDVFGIDVNRETEYDSNYAQAGVSYSWISGRFMLRGGYTFQVFDRDYIDDAIEARGGKAYETNHTLTGELSVRVAKQATVFVRGTAMSNQLMGEIPFAYNTVTAKRFDKEYGIVSAGVMVGF